MSKLESKFGIGKVMIIESIPESEPQTGTKLFNELKYLEKIHQTDISIEYERVDTNQQLFDCLEKLHKDVTSNHKVPMLHIEAHGRQDVLKLSSGESINWIDFVEPFTRINIATHNNFLVVVSAFFGAYIMEIIKIGKLDRSPIFAAIGPSEEVSSGKLESGYQAFYHELLKTRDINKAMDTFNEKKPGMANSFILVSLTMLS